jgi:hypothetical protein
MSKSTNQKIISIKAITAYKTLYIEGIFRLCIGTMWRPRSDRGKLKFHNIKFKYNMNTELEGVTILAMETKEIQPKESKLGINVGFLLLHPTDTWLENL